MISNIYIPTCTTIQKHGDESHFHEFVISEYAACAKDHFLPGRTLKSISYQTDSVVTGFITRILGDQIESLGDFKQKGADLETGYYHLEIESEWDLSKQILPDVEFIFQLLHEEFSFIASLQYYVTESGIRQFAKMHTFNTNTDTENYTYEHLQDYTTLLESYLETGNVPESYTVEVAKWMLTGRAI